MSLVLCRKVKKKYKIDIFNRNYATKKKKRRNKKITSSEMIIKFKLTKNSEFILAWLYDQRLFCF